MEAHTHEYKGPDHPDLETGENHEDDIEVSAHSNGAGQPQSVIDQIKKRRRQLGQARTLTMEIPGYDGLLFARYHYVDGMYDELRKIVERADRSSSPRREINAQMDVLILACQEVLAYRPDDPQADDQGRAPIDPEETTRFDTHLAELLDFEAKRSRDVVAGVFRNNLAIAAQHNDLMIWAASNQQEIDEETEGESEGTSPSS